MSSISFATKNVAFIKGSKIDFNAALAKKNEVYVFEFWATWCPPCRQSIPHLTKIAKQVESKGVKMIGVTSEDVQTAKRFVDSMGSKMDYTVVSDPEGEIAEPLMTKYAVGGIPHAFIVGKDGSVKWHGHPMDPRFAAEIDKAAAEPGAASDNDSRDSNLVGKSADELSALPVKSLKSFLASRGVSTEGVLEKSELVQLVQKQQ